ncbi:unnamed protein product [Rotaria magnacalcarata]|uniref:Uncharacterized protein n=1 Tax=Rotaria magnacalcarata TaxID=392030 RepID=A0A816ZP79_9BILA|nr:unnamed protein product [Rotaria magnacalcarata]CAF1656536.1 unnamed protein product [Rotaria magnacalcarata]CAF2060326.1 unnamed protein product [Rotaria magnacalcarata]CAF2112177.1 unnamed protein product [Rotaria magnacalcarata]CAF2224504.1 unnamed protein product [Rotaria magnacalcarata]
MIVDRLNRKMSFVGTCFAFIGVILSVMALTTNYWSSKSIILLSQIIETQNGSTLSSGKIERKWNGLFYLCTDVEIVQCVFKFESTTFVFCLVGLICLLIGGISLCWDLLKISNRRFIIPMLFFVACLSITAGIFEYGSSSHINSYSSRTMIGTIIFAYSALAISTFVAGRCSALDNSITNEKQYVTASTDQN